MCLDKLEDFEVTQKHGWQVFDKTSVEGLRSCYHGNQLVPIGKWQRDKFRIFNRWIYIDSAIKKYKKGFHIFLNEEDAVKYCPGYNIYCVRKVRFKRVVARGLQEIVRVSVPHHWMARVVICRKRFVEPEETENMCRHAN